MSKRLFLANVFAGIGIASLLLAAAVRVPKEIAIVFTWAPRKVYPPGLMVRVREVQTRVPENALLLYIDPKVDYWQYGLWKRALHPRNRLELATDEEGRKEGTPLKGYALVVGRPVDGMKTASVMALTAYEGSPVMHLVEIR